MRCWRWVGSWHWRSLHSNNRGIPGSMKLFGHPIHMMLVHFPAALLPMDFLCSAAYLMYPESGLVAAGFYAMMAGTVLGWLAVVSGTFDLLTVMKENENALKSALIHGGINGSVL